MSAWTARAWLALMLLAFVGGCSGDLLHERRATRLRIAHTTVPNFADIPAVIATRMLAEKGYEIHTTHFAHASLAAEAVSRRDADVGFGGLSTYWAAAARGARIVTVMEQARNSTVLIAAQPVDTCRELSGRRLAVNNVGATGATLLEAYIAGQCPGTAPDLIVMPVSTTRAAAFDAGVVQAAILMREDVVDIQLRAPDRVGLVEDLGARWPRLVTSGVTVNEGFARAQPQAVEDLVTACLTAQRLAGTDPVRLAAEAVKALGIDKDWLPAARAYMRANTWDLNGGLSPDSVRETVKFLAAAGVLPADVDPAALIDRSFLDRALDTLGREPLP